MPEMNVVYIRHRGPYNLIGQAIEKIMKWSAARDLINFPDTKIISVYHDDPNITEKEKLRFRCMYYSSGRSLKQTEKSAAMLYPGGKFAVGSTWKLDMMNLVKPGIGWWESGFPKNGFQSDNRLCYEICLNDPKKHPEGKFVVDICEPVKPL